MRKIMFAVLPLLAGVAAFSQTVSGTMPDVAKEYHLRFNCHNAYDFLIGELDANREPSAAQIDWAKAHEKLAKIWHNLRAASAGNCPPRIQSLDFDRRWRRYGRAVRRKSTGCCCL